MEQKREPMNKNRMMRPTVRDEQASDCEVRIHQEHWSARQACEYRAESDSSTAKNRLSAADLPFRFLV